MIEEVEGERSRRPVVARGKPTEVEQLIPFVGEVVVGVETFAEPYLNLMDSIEIYNDDAARRLSRARARTPIRMTDLSDNTESAKGDFLESCAIPALRRNAS